jgi:hypothetical protein
MKKIALFFLLSIFGVTMVSAEDLTPEQRRFRDQIEQFLKEEGYVPTVDPDDNSLNWKKEGERFWLYVEGSDPLYIEIHKPSLGVDNANMDLVYESINQANRGIRCAKAVMGKTSIIFTVEFYCPSIDEFRRVFYRSTNALSAVRDKTKEYYSEHK